MPTNQTAVQYEFCSVMAIPLMLSYGQFPFCLNTGCSVTMLLVLATRTSHGWKLCMPEYVGVQKLSGRSALAP